jgi:hypothetical protein
VSDTYWVIGAALVVLALMCTIVPLASRAKKQHLFTQLHNSGEEISEELYRHFRSKISQLRRQNVAVPEARVALLLALAGGGPFAQSEHGGPVLTNELYAPALKVYSQCVKRLVTDYCRAKGVSRYLRKTSSLDRDFRKLTVYVGQQPELCHDLMLLAVLYWNAIGQANSQLSELSSHAQQRLGDYYALTPWTAELHNCYLDHVGVLLGLDTRNREYVIANLLRVYLVLRDNPHVMGSADIDRSAARALFESLGEFLPDLSNVRSESLTIAALEPLIHEPARNRRVSQLLLHNFELVVTLMQSVMPDVRLDCHRLEIYTRAGECYRATVPIKLVMD